MESLIITCGFNSYTCTWNIPFFRTRRRKNKSRKYGLISSSGNDLEMEPLDQDDEDDEDMTVFEVNNRGKK